METQEKSPSTSVNGFIIICINGALAIFLRAIFAKTKKRRKFMVVCIINVPPYFPIYRSSFHWYKFVHFVLLLSFLSRSAPRYGLFSASAYVYLSFLFAAYRACYAVSPGHNSHFTSYHEINTSFISSIPK